MAGTNLYAPTVNSNVFADLTNEAGYVDTCELRGTTVLPTTTGLFSKGCMLKIENNGELYINTAADGAAPSWVAAGAGGLASALTNAHIFVGNGANTATDVAVSGDLTLANTGAFTIANNAVTTAKILNNAVTGAKIALTGQVTGSIMYYDGTDWIHLAPGADGTVLTLAGGVPTWV